MVPELANESFGALIEVTNGVGIFVERALYNDALGAGVGGGHQRPRHAAAVSTLIPARASDGPGARAPGPFCVRSPATRPGSEPAPEAPAQAQPCAAGDSALHLTPMIINRVRPLSVGKIAAFLYGLIGLFIGALIAVFALFGGLAAGRPAPPAKPKAPAAAFGALFGVAGVAAIVIAPLFYGVMGFIGAVIMALIYNLVARVVGGIEVDVS